MEMGSHALGGKFTTLEGLLKNVQDQIDQNPLYGSMASGDSATEEDRQRLASFKDRLNRMIEGEDLPFTVILDDPCGNSYLQVQKLAPCLFCLFEIMFRTEKKLKTRKSLVVFWSILVQPF